MKKYICYVTTAFLAACFSFTAYGQVTPPGQGGRLVIWTALEVEQPLSKRFTSHTTFGIGRHSAQNDYAILEQQGIITIREGVSYQLTPHLGLSLTAMYGQKKYYEENEPLYQQEIRVYPKLKHHFKLGSLSFSQYIRFDFRRFYQPDWSDWKNPFEFRPRYQLKVSRPISRNKRTTLLLLTEWMGASKSVRMEENEQTIHSMQPFRFTENRTSLYVRRHLNKLNWYVDLGVMHQYWRQQGNHFGSTFLFGADVVIKNPFQALRHL